MTRLSDIRSLLQQCSKELQSVLQLDLDAAHIEARSLLQAALQVNHAHLLSHPERTLSEAEHRAYMRLLEGRLRGEPIAYLLGEREFFGLNFKVTPDTLIPRPETELLVELALQRIPQAVPCRVLDMGTGSGAIALSIAHARPLATVVALDASNAALEVARQNAQWLQLGNVQLLHSDWFAELQNECFDVIVSNPPYIAADDTHLTLGDVRFEPRMALTSGMDGLADIRHICVHAKNYLGTNGWLLFEHGYDQAEAVCALLHQEKFTEVFSARDLSGIARVSGGKIAPENTP